MFLSVKKTASALLILGHGSTQNATSSRSVRAHADEIRSRDLFAEVHTAFWRERPAFNEVLANISATEVYAVPAFISEGYFTRQVIPRELGITGSTTRLDHHVIHYCDPVGSHPSMTDRLLERATRLTPGIDRSEIAVIIVGHGTPRDTNSAAAIRLQVERLSAPGIGFAKVTDAYLSEAPSIGDWDQLTDAHHVVVVPFFIADGLHSEEDIPEELGLDTTNADRFEAQKLRGRTVYYSRPIGTDPGIADVILEQVMAFDERSESQ